MEQLESLWEGLKLNEKEKVVMEEEHWEEVENSKELCFIWRIWIERTIGKYTIETIMAKYGD